MPDSQRYDRRRPRIPRPVDGPPLMILRDLGLILIHIPKCAGTSIEHNLTAQRPKIEDPPDYELAWGWCPDRRIWMQHATPQQLVDLELISRKDFDEMFSFTIVRNPYARAVSDYYFLRRQIGGAGSFDAMLKAEGRWERILSDATTPEYRGDHLRAQLEYLTIDGHAVIDHVGRAEDLDSTYTVLESRLGKTLDRSIHQKAAPNYFRHYSQFYANPEVEFVKQTYSEDLRQLRYNFDDRRTSMSRRERRPRRALASLDSVWFSGKRVIKNVLNRS